MLTEDDGLHIEWGIRDRRTGNFPAWWNQLPNGWLTSSSESREIAEAAANAMGQDHEVVQWQK